MIRPCFEHESDTTGSRRLVPTLCFEQGFPIRLFLGHHQQARLLIVEEPGYPLVVGILLELIPAYVCVDLFEIGRRGLEGIPPIAPSPEVIHRFETALHEIDLIGLWIE